MFIGCLASTWAANWFVSSHFRDKKDVTTDVASFSPKSKSSLPRLVNDTAVSVKNQDARVDSTNNRTTITNRVIIDSLSKDTLKTDSIVTDTTQKKKREGLDAPVEYSAQDSITYDASSGLVSLFGNSNVSYQNMALKGENIQMSMDSNLVHAQGVIDTSGQWKGKPVFTQGSDKYESEKMSYNFKTKKGFISNVTTEQGEGFMRSEHSKRAADGTLYLEHARYTTCDDKNPHFYLSLSRAKVKPGKEAIFGPAYLVVADVPLPLAIPYGFFPFSKKYSSGFIMPTYGDETKRGFYLREGGYYFAISDYMDLKLLGEIYTKGSWGFSTELNYNKRYRYSGNFYLNYQNTIDGEKNMPDYEKTTSFKVQWSHRQNAKAASNSSFSASVNFATTSFERKNLSSLYNPASYTQSTRTSSVSYSRTFERIGLTLSSTMNLSQNMRDSTIGLTLPDLNISLARFYPFKRKNVKGNEKWYEKISVSYTGQLSNSITTKEDKLLHSNLIKDWRNGMSHNIPISATFQVLKYINVSPSFSFTDRMYTNKTMRSWDSKNQKELRDTLYGFYNVYNWDLSLSANTTLYGFYKPSRKIFGDKIIAVRHVLKPEVSFHYAPDFGSDSYGYYDSYVKTDANGNVSTVSYSPFSGSLFGVPSSGKTGSISMKLSNNVEMKVKSDKDSTGEKKISLIDELSGQLSYNLAAKVRPWSNLTTNIRLKLTKNYTFSLNAVFATYAYKFNENGQVVTSDRTEWSYGRFGRFQGMSQNFSYTFNNQTLKRWFSKKGNKAQPQEVADEKEDDYEQPDLNNEDGNSNIDPDLKSSKNSAQKTAKARVDKDGYLMFQFPWSLTVSYGISMHEDRSKKINERTMRYPYSYTQTMNFSGNIRLSEGWNINFSSGYDFNYHKLSMTTASLSRDLHCFAMTCSVVLSPYTSYNFSFRAKTSTLADVLKWDKRSSYSTNIDWY